MNSIQSEIDPHILANEIRMHKKSHEEGSPLSVLLVEGSSDSSLFDKFVKKDYCVIIPAFSRDNVLGTLCILDDDGITGVLGLVDRDYMDFFPTTETSQNIVYTDENDIEMMLICSPAFDHVLREYGKQIKIRTAEEQYGETAREIIFRESACIGVLRLISKLDGLNLRFSDMRFKFGGASKIEIKLDDQCTHLLLRSQDPISISAQELKARAETIIQKTQHMKTLCSGHDCVRILGRALRGIFGSDSKFDSGAKAKELERVLRLAYERAFFKHTKTYSSIRAWEDLNGHLILE